MLVEYIDTIIYDLFPNHTATTAYNKYKKKSTLHIDCKAVYTAYKTQIIAGKTKWLKNNVVIIGTKSCGIYLSMIYNKTGDDTLIYKLIEYLRSVDKEVDNDFKSNDSSHSTDSSNSTDSSDSSNSSDSSEDTDDDQTCPLDIIKNIYQTIQPKISTVVTNMELPPPDGVILSKKNREIKEADILAVKKGIAEFESAIK